MSENMTKQNEDIQWETFRRKAEDLRIASKNIREISVEEKEKIFLQRSNRLRLDNDKSTEDKEVLKVISFHVAREFFGIEVKYLQEVYEVYNITRIPCTPPVLVGLINYRGTVLTIINLKILFDLKGNSTPGKDSSHNDDINAPLSVPTKILIVEYSGNKAGILIDKLDNLLELQKDEIKPVSSFFRNKNKIVTSEIKINNVPLLFIDPEELLNDERLKVNEDV